MARFCQQKQFHVLMCVHIVATSVQIYWPNSSKFSSAVIPFKNQGGSLWVKHMEDPVALIGALEMKSGFHIFKGLFSLNFGVHLIF